MSRSGDPIGHAAYHAMRRGKTNTMRVRPRLYFFHRELLAKTVGDLKLSQMTAMKVTDQNLHPDHQQ